MWDSGSNSYTIFNHWHDNNLWKLKFPFSASATMRNSDLSDGYAARLARRSNQCVAMDDWAEIVQYNVIKSVLYTIKECTYTPPDQTTMSAKKRKNPTALSFHSCMTICLWRDGHLKCGNCAQNRVRGTLCAVNLSQHLRFNLVHTFLVFFFFSISFETKCVPKPVDQFHWNWELFKVVSVHSVFD